MVLAKDLKRIIDEIPDNIPVTLGECYDCDIVGFSISSMEGVAKLKLTEGYGVVTDSFIDGIINALSEERRRHDNH